MSLICVRHKLKGLSHTECQDSFAFDETPVAMIAAVADGVSSEKHSEFGSQVACDTVVSFCAKNIQNGMKDDDVLRVIYQGFDQAWNAVEQGARDRNYDVRQCNTTLTLAVFINGDIYYGQAGDSGLFAFFDDGIIAPVTTPQNDSEGRVYALSSSTKWEFNKAPKKAVSLLMCTDGIWNTFFPVRLVGAKEEYSVPLLAWYIDPEAIKAHSEHDGFQKWLESDMDEINRKPENVNYDDLTIVIMHDDSLPYKRQPEQYYEPPSEEELEQAKKAEHERLYGHLSDADKNRKQISGSVITKEIKSEKNKMLGSTTSPSSTSSGTTFPILIQSGEKPFIKICEYDMFYGLSIKERVDLAIIVFVKLARLSKKSKTFYPLDIFVITDKPPNKIDVRFGDEYSESSTAYYRIIRQVAMLLTNGLALPTPSGQNYFSPEETFLTKELFELFLQSFNQFDKKDKNIMLPHPDVWANAIRNHLATLKLCKCHNPAHFDNISSLEDCRWCTIDKTRADKTKH